jgi:formylglycine-generating enzyme required for sulfatase activity
MIFVSGLYCPRVERECLDPEPNFANHITLCHAFAHETHCVAPEEERAFCIDELEYPNTKGAHPPWMVTWADAQATCESKGKRLCFESEWTMACEGPERTPFPYGWERDNTACNIDNEYIAPSIDKMNAIDPPDAGDAAVQAPELARLDQSVPSGALARCVSGYGARDMTGNFDEWVTSDAPVPSGGADVGKYAALKGGAWGHVRNACRPVTTSHAPEWSYYFVSFRCCADARGRAAYVPPPTAYPAPSIAPADRAPIPKVRRPAGPSRRKVTPQRSK